MSTFNLHTRDCSINLLHNYVWFIRYIERPPTLTDEPEDWELEYEEVRQEREAASTRVRVCWCADTYPAIDFRISVAIFAAAGVNTWMEIAVRTLALQLRTITCYSQPLPEGLFPLQSVYPELEEEAMRIVEERRGLFIYVVTTSLAVLTQCLYSLVEMREAGKPEEQYDFQGRYAQVRSRAQLA